MSLRIYSLALLLSAKCIAQSAVTVLPSAATNISVDSKNNVILHIYGGRIMMISPDGDASYISADIRKNMSAPLPACKAMAVDFRDVVYIASMDLIWKIALDGKVTHFAGVPYKNEIKDGTLENAQFREIQFMEIDRMGNIYLAERDDTNKNDLGDYFLIRKISTSGSVKTIINTRENPDFKTKWISGMGIDLDGNLFVSDGNERCIRKIAPDGKVTVIAGLCGKRDFHPVYIEGDIVKAELMAPQDISVNNKGEIVFSDGRLNRIIKVADKKATTIAGNSVIQPNSVNMGGRSKEGYKDGPAAFALFNFPLGCDIAIDSRQNIYIIDGGNSCIRKLSAAGQVTTFAKWK